MNLLIQTRSISRKGFTLLEILIAMFIFAVVLTTIFTSYTGTFKIIDETESQADIYSMARTVLIRMQEDLESIHFKETGASKSEGSSIKPALFLGENKEIKGRDADTLRFLSRAHLIFDEEGENPGVAEISYYVSKNEAEDSLALYRSDRPQLEEPQEEGAGGLILCDGLFSVNITYHDADGQMHENWDSSEGEFKHKLPAMVSIFLEFANTRNAEKPHKFMTRVALPMARERHE
jgi:general secretion pathway protein J